MVEAGGKLDAKDKRGLTALNIAAGLNIGGTFKAWPETAALLRQLMRERGLVVEENSLAPSTIPSVGAQ